MDPLQQMQQQLQAMMMDMMGVMPGSHPGTFVPLPLEDLKAWESQAHIPATVRAVRSLLFAHLPRAHVATTPFCSPDARASCTHPRWRAQTRCGSLAAGGGAGESTSVSVAGREGSVRGLGSEKTGLIAPPRL